MSRINAFYEWALPYIWWVPIAIVLLVGVVILIAEGIEWYRNEWRRRPFEWFSTDAKVLRPPAYRDMRASLEIPHHELPASLRRQAE